MGEQDYTIYQETAIPCIRKEGEKDLSLQIFEEACMIGEEQEQHTETFDLGYAPTQAEIIEIKDKLRRRKVDKAYDPTIEILHIWESFPKANHIQ